MLTTAGPYFCTMVLKSGNTAVGLPVAGTGVTGPVEVAGGGDAVLAAPGVTPNAYKALTGAATIAAPSTAAASGLRIKVLTLIAVSPTITGHRGCDMPTIVGRQT